MSWKGLGGSNFNTCQQHHASIDSGESGGPHVTDTFSSRQPGELAPWVYWTDIWLIDREGFFWGRKST
jgi:hypothetical protein